jgi:hypothetical protein
MKRQHIRTRLCLEELESRLVLSPTVTVVAEVPKAYQTGPSPGIFKFTRTGDNSQALTANFTFGGTATLGTDYLAWETSANFAPGSSVARVTVLPRNAHAQHGNQTVTLTLAPGNGYDVGTRNPVTVTIVETYVARYPGVFDWVDYPTLQNDITYLDASISGSNLQIAVGLYQVSIAASNNVEVFLDVDQDRTTGDFRNGYVAGAEYRITSLANSLFPDYALFRLPRTPTEKEQQIYYTSASMSGNILILNVPLSKIGNPTAVDLFAVAHNRSDASRIPGDGNRVPEYGWFDTSSRQVVVRNPGVTQSIVVPDPQGDALYNGYDLTAAEFDTIADQFFIYLTFAQSFDPTSLIPGPRGYVYLDSDNAGVVTGGVGLGGDIPTWGIDQRLLYELSTPAPFFAFQPDPSGTPIIFGKDRNDGRWLARGKTLFMAGSLSLFDSILQTWTGSTIGVTRIPTNGQMLAKVSSLELGRSLLDARESDVLPDGKNMVDITTGQSIAPYAWDSSMQSVPDTIDLGWGVFGDFDRVDAQVTSDFNLVVRGHMTTFQPTEVGVLFEVLLDSDMDATTGTWFSNYLKGGATLGADYIIRISSVDTGGAPVYLVDTILPDGTALISDAMAFVQPHPTAGAGASFTVTIPLGYFQSLYQNIGPQVRFFVTSGHLAGADPIDIAPAQPFVVDLTGGGPAPAPAPPAPPQGGTGLILPGTGPGGVVLPETAGALPMVVEFLLADMRRSGRFDVLTFDTPDRRPASRRGMDQRDLALFVAWGQAPVLPENDPLAGASGDPSDFTVELQGEPSSQPGNGTWKDWTRRRS